MVSDTNDNRRPTWMLLEVVVGEKMTKTNSKKQNSKSQVETSSLKLIIIIVHKQIVGWVRVKCSAHYVIINSTFSGQTMHQIRQVKS